MSYSYIRALTIDHTQVGSADSSGFPMVFSGTYSWLATVANAGHVQSSSGYDIVFTSDAAGLSVLPFERVNYSPTTGLSEFWVKVPTVSHTTDTVVYIAYGDASVTTDQSNQHGTWDSNFEVVYHLPDGTTLSANDSTSNGNNASALNGTSAATGQIGGGASFNGSSNSIDITNSSSLNTWTGQTISLWIKAQTGMANFARMIEKGSNTEWTIGWNYSTGDNKLAIQSFATSALSFKSTGAIADNTWHKIDVSFAASGSATVKLYVDGLLDNSAGDSPSSGGTGNIRLGQFGGGGFYYHGLADELKISNIVRSADWILSEYNNQTTASTFYTVGSEGAPSGSIVATFRKTRSPIGARIGSRQSAL